MANEKNPWRGSYTALRKQGNSLVFVVTDFVKKIELDTEFELKFRRKDGLLSKDVQEAILRGQADSAKSRTLTKQNLAYQVVCTRNMVTEKFDPDVIIDNLKKHTRLIGLFRNSFIVYREKYDENLLEELINKYGKENGRLTFQNESGEYFSSDVEKKRKLLENNPDSDEHKKELKKAEKALEGYHIKRNSWIWTKIKEKHDSEIKSIGADSVDVELALYDLCYDITRDLMQDRVGEIIRILGIKNYWDNINAKKKQNGGK